LPEECWGLVNWAKEKDMKATYVQQQADIDKQGTCVPQFVFARFFVEFLGVSQQGQFKNTTFFVGEIPCRMSKKKSETCLSRIMAFSCMESSQHHANIS
jgi:hypothetical protein